MRLNDFLSKCVLLEVVEEIEIVRYTRGQPQWGCRCYDTLLSGSFVFGLGVYNYITADVEYVIDPVKGYKKAKWIQKPYDYIFVCSAQGFLKGEKFTINQAKNPLSRMSSRKLNFFKLVYNNINKVSAASVPHHGSQTITDKFVELENRDGKAVVKVVA